jgi:hypothetical protein
MHDLSLWLTLVKKPRSRDVALLAPPEKYLRILSLVLDAYPYRNGKRFRRGTVQLLTLSETHHPTNGGSQPCW